MGNVRLGYSDADDNNRISENEIIEENHYYPFGLKHSAYNTQHLSYVPIDQLNNLILNQMPRFAGDGENNYKYNGKEYQDELGLNMTAMDYRQYDNAIGRFVVVDPFAELSYSMTPYKFAYNSPVYWNDPLGLFETRDEAKAYAKEHGIRTGWFSQNKIQKGEDGTWSINNAKGSTSTYAASADVAAVLGINEGDIVTSALVESEAKPSKSNSFGWFTVWGSDRSGDTSGMKGTTYESVESSQIPSFSGSKARDIKGSGGFLAWLKSLFTGAKDVVDINGKIETIQAINQKPNTSTMEVQNKEPVSPPKQSTEIVVKQYHIQLDTKTVDSVDVTRRFSGTQSEVQKKVDSTKENSKSQRRTSRGFFNQH